MSAEQITALEKRVSDPTSQAVFTRLGVCIRPGLFDDQEYKFGEIRRLTQKEKEREDDRTREAMLYDKIKLVQDQSFISNKRLRDLEEEEKLEKERFEQRMSRLKDERKELELSKLEQLKQLQDMGVSISKRTD